MTSAHPCGGRDSRASRRFGSAGNIEITTTALAALKRVDFDEKCRVSVASYPAKPA